MNCRLRWISAGAGVAVALGTANGLERPQLVWTRTFAAGSNPYYLNDNRDQGSLLVGQIGFGGRNLDASGGELHSLSTVDLMPGNAGAKCMVRLGDYYYLCHHDAAGIARIDVPVPWTNVWDGSTWAPPSPAAIDITDPATGSGIGPESIVTDGMYLYSNDDNSRARIHCLSVAAGAFAVTHQWSVDLPAGGRVRGLTYHPRGYLYMHNGGDSDADTTLYAVRLSDRAVFDMGPHVEGNRVYQVLRHGDELLVFGLSDLLTVYELASDTRIAAGGPRQTFDLGVGDLYGAAQLGDRFFVAHTKSVSLFRIPPRGTLLEVRRGYR